MNNKGMAAMAAELQAAKSALEAARKELAAAKNHRDSPASNRRTAAAELAATGARDPIAGRYLMLLVIGVLAAWQVYLTIELKILLN